MISLFIFLLFLIYFCLFIFSYFHPFSYNIYFGNLKAQYQTTVDDEEVFKFSQLCNEFWDINGPFQALHTMNRLRVSLIKEAVLYSSGNSTTSATKPLQNKRILDIGCGGGILSEVIISRNVILSVLYMFWV